MEVRKITFEENKKITYTSFTLLLLALLVFVVSEGGILNNKTQVEAGVSNTSGKSTIFCWDYFGRKKMVFNNVAVAPPYLNTDKQSFLDFYTTNPNEIYFDVDNDGDMRKHPPLAFDLGPDFNSKALAEVEKALVNSGVSASAFTYNKKDPAATYLAYYDYVIRTREAEFDGLVERMKVETNLNVKKRLDAEVKKINSLLDIYYGEKTRLKQFTDSKAKYPRQVCQGPANLPDKYVPADEQAQKILDLAVSASQNIGTTTSTGGTGTTTTTGGTGTTTGTGTGGTTTNPLSDPNNPYNNVYNGTYNPTGTTTTTSTGGTGTTTTTTTTTGGTGTGTGTTTGTGGTGTGTGGTGTGTGGTGGGGYIMPTNTSTPTSGSTMPTSTSTSTGGSTMPMMTPTGP